jgi:NADH:ubiquinone oxidoreductase subunit 2 (subunit N)
MNGLLFLGVSVGAAVVALLLRPVRGAALAVGLLGLAIALLVASGIEPGAGIRVGDVALVGTAYARLVLVLATAAALVTFVIGWADDEPPSYGPASLAVLGAVGAALLVDDPIVGLLLVLAAGIVGILVVLGGEGASATAIGSTVRALRAVVVAGALTIGAAAWLARPLGALALEPAVFGVAYLGMAGAVALRSGVVPFHLWFVRLADSAPAAALPVFAVWVPVALTVVVLNWVDQAIAPILVPLETERAVVAVVGLASLLLGALAAWLADDHLHLAVYVTVAEAGLALLGLTVLDPAVWQPLRSWLVAVAVVQTGLFGWVAAVRVTTGSRRVADAGRALAEGRPVGRLLGLALAGVALGAVGLPGWSIWAARERIAELAVGPAGPGVAALAILPYLALLRPVVAGLRGRAAGGAARVDRSAGRGMGIRGGGIEWRGRGIEWRGRVARHGTPRAMVAAIRSGRFARTVEGEWRRNRALVATLGALLLAVLAVASSAGWLGLDEAAAGGPPSAAEGELLGNGLEGTP